MNTTTISNSITQREQDKFRTISLTALLTGLLQMASIIVKYLIETGKNPLSPFKYIASGIFGKEALDGGLLMITWGIVFHFMIAFLFTAFLFLIYPKVIRWLKNKFVAAILYGFFAWAVINLIIVPLSKIHKLPPDAEQAIIAAGILIFTIGAPVALIAHGHYSQKRSA